MYFSASMYMGFTVNFFLLPKFELQRAYMAYPAMTAVYVSATNLKKILIEFSFQFTAFL